MGKMLLVCFHVWVGCCVVRGAQRHAIMREVLHVRRNGSGVKFSCRGELDFRHVIVLGSAVGC